MELSNKEYGIIEYLARNKWYPKSKADILEAYGECVRQN
jgi:DNA-binding response OmpR family regulator